MTETDADIDITPGRPVRLAKTPPGSATLVLGLVIAALAPLLGFLGGSLMGEEPPGQFLFEPIYWGLFLGVIIGAVGVLMSIVGGRRLWLHNKDRKLMSETVDAPSEPPYVADEHEA